MQTALLFGACDGTRTCDLLITNELHYQLCYTSITKRYNTLYRILKAMSRENPIIYEKADSMAAVRFGVSFIQYKYQFLLSLSFRVPAFTARQ